MTRLAIIDLFTLLAAIPVAALGGASFLQGVLGVATWLRLPRLLVATTIAAFATSSPELAVSSLAALAGKPEIGLGDALGSNVVNVGLILGSALLFGALATRRNELGRDFVFALCVPVLTLGLALDGTLSRADGTVLLALFVLWSALVIRQAATLRRETSTDSSSSLSAVRAWGLLLLGLASLLLAGRLFVTGASGIAVAWGVHPYLIGVTVVALGTSLPEGVTVLLSRLRGHDEIGLGTLLGSNLFNGLAIVGVAATLHPIRVPFGEIVVTLAFGALVILLMVPRADAISRRRGIVLLGTYVAFVWATLDAPA